MKEEKKIRQSNFELMRIISMILIIMWHLIFHGGLLETNPTKINIILELFILIGAVHVNSFILVTGYFQESKKINYKKVLSLIATSWFYRVFFLVIALLIGTFTISKLEIFNELLPIDMRDYWFINLYLVLYIISPYLNIIVSKINQQDFKRILIGGFIIFSIIPFITNNKTIANDGYTITNFCYLYLIGAYLKKFPIKESSYLKKYTQKKQRYLFLSIMIFFCLLNFIGYQLSKNIIGENEIINQMAINYCASYRAFSNPFIILQTIGYFLFFSTLTIKSKVINKVSTFTLEAYLIHENFYVLNIIYDIMKTRIWYQYGGTIVIGLTLIIPFLIFLLCVTVSTFRNKILQFIKKRKTYKKIKEIGKQYLTKISKNEMIKE